MVISAGLAEMAAAFVAGAIATETAIKPAKIRRTKAMRNYPATSVERQSAKLRLTRL
jgi:hypothetical protein